MLQQLEHFTHHVSEHGSVFNNQVVQCVRAVRLDTKVVRSSIQILNNDFKFINSYFLFLILYYYFFKKKPLYSNHNV